jgi:putative aldouronate transport system permease protein
MDEKNLAIQPEGQINLKVQFIRVFRRDKYLYLMFLPPLLFYLVFHYAPMYGVLVAFKQFSIKRGIMGSDWVGLRYVKQFLADPYFWLVFKNTLIINLYNLLWSFPAPIILALLLNELRWKRIKSYTQTISYLPHFLSTVVVVGMLTSFLSGNGIINRGLGILGLGPYPFLTDARFFRTVYIASGIWQGVGWGSIIYLAALSMVDLELYEAAIIDGAGRWKRVLYVTLPGITPTITIMLILETGRIMNVAFQKILLLMNGPNMLVSDVISTFVYRRGIAEADFSYATGVGLFQSIVALIFVTSCNAISRRVSETSLW